MHKQALKGFLLAALGLGTVHCKTMSGTSNLKDDGDVPGATATVVESWAQRMGLVLQDGTGGVQVAKAAEGEYAHAIGLAAGDVIQALNGKPVADADAFETVARSFASGQVNQPWDGVWTFTVSRGGQVKQVQQAPGYDCNPFILAVCGPLSGPG